MLARADRHTRARTVPDTRAQLSPGTATGVCDRTCRRPGRGGRVGAGGGGRVGAGGSLSPSPPSPPPRPLLSPPPPVARAPAPPSARARLHRMPQARDPRRARDALAPTRAEPREQEAEGLLALVAGAPRQWPAPRLRQAGPAASSLPPRPRALWLLVTLVAALGFPRQRPAPLSPRDLDAGEGCSRSAPQEDFHRGRRLDQGLNPESDVKPWHGYTRTMANSNNLRYP